MRSVRRRRGCPSARRSDRRIDAHKSSPCSPAATRAACGPPSRSPVRRRASTTRATAGSPSRFAAVYRQLTLRPAKLITTSQPSISLLPIAKRRAIPGDDAPRPRVGTTAQDDHVVAIRVKCASENRPDLSGSAWNDDLHTHSPLHSMKRPRNSGRGIRHCSERPNTRYRFRATRSYTWSRIAVGRMRNRTAIFQGHPSFAGDEQRGATPGEDPRAVRVDSSPGRETKPDRQGCRRNGRPSSCRFRFEAKRS